MTQETPRTAATGNTTLELRRIAQQLETELQGRENQIAMIQEDRNRLVEENQNLLSQIEEAKEMLLEAAAKLQEAGVDADWHNPENVSIEQLGHGYRFLKPWEVNAGYGADKMGISDAWKDGSWDHYCDCKWKSKTYRVPASTPILKK
jgi:hypothetical protein